MKSIKTEIPNDIMHQSYTDMAELKASFEKYTFHFNFPGGTSRGVLTTKDSWFIKLWKKNTPDSVGLGEVSILPGLSPETPEDVEKKLNEIIEHPDFYSKQIDAALKKQPAIKFGLESALLDMENGGKQHIYPSEFTMGKAGITINGLIWMGEKKLMLKRIKEKLDNGFKCLKLKIGAINFDDELDLLRTIRKEFSSSDLELRVDANGAFSMQEAILKLDKLNKFQLHSIEQPIKQGQWSAMAALCKDSPIPIALDEELIGIEDKILQQQMLETIKPHYLIFKPSLIGGIKATEQWGKLADSLGIKWWVTSALEGNIGLNAIAQWTFTQNSSLPQGLGTGQVFSNNLESPLHLKGEKLFFNPNKAFKL